MPINKSIPFEWYETPNIHFCSIKDFENLCKKLGFLVEKKVFLTAKHQLLGLLGHDFIANFFAEYGIFLITKNHFAATNQEEFAFAKKLLNGFQPSPAAACLSTK